MTNVLPFAAPAGQTDPPLVTLDELPRNGESKTRSATRPVGAVKGPPESVEHAGLFRLGDAGSVVLHRDPRPSP
jgi:hypothetical protein